MEQVSQSASAVIAPHVIVAVMVTHRLSIHRNHALINVCAQRESEQLVSAFLLTKFHSAHYILCNEILTLMAYLQELITALHLK